jgi:putative ABC transport system permease protein
VFRALWRKGRADLASRPLQTLLLFVVIAVGAATLTLALTIRGATSQSVERFVEHANAAHVWYFSDVETLDAVAERAFVEGYSGAVPALDGGTLLTGATPQDLSFFGIGEEQPAIGFGVLTDGRWPSPARDGAPIEATLDRGLGREFDLELGDTISVATRGGTFELAIVGFAIPTSRAPFPVWFTARIFVTPEDIDTLGGGRPGYFAGGYRLDDPMRADTFMRGVAQTVRAAPPPIFAGRSWLSVRDAIQEDNQGGTLLLGTFAGFTLLAAALIVANSVTGQVQSQLRDVGLLKAIGATPRQVATLLVVEVTVIAATAAVLGLVAGRLLTPIFLGDVHQLLNTSDAGSIKPVLTAGIPAAVIGLAILVTLVPAVRVGRTSAAAALAGAAPPGGGVSRLARVATALRLSRVVAFGLKDPFTRRTRAWLTVGAIGVASASIVAASTLESTLDAVVSNPALVGVPPAELQIERLSIEEGDGFEPISDAELVAAIEAHPDIDGWISRRSVNVNIGGQQFGAFGIAGQTDRVPLAITEGRLFEESGEAAIGLGLSRRLGLGVGDKTLVRFFNDRGPSRVITVVGIYIEDENNGEWMAMSLEDVRRAWPEANAGDFWVAVNDTAEVSTVQGELREATGGRAAIFDIDAELADDVGEIRGDVRPLLLSLSGFLLVLVGLNVLAALTLAVRERTREIGVMKTIGFTPIDVVVSVISGALFLAAVGALIGAPLGWVFMRLLLENAFAGEGFQTGDLVQQPSLVWLGGMLVAVTLVTVAGALPPARRAVRLSVSEALRYE